MYPAANAAVGQGTTTGRWSTRRPLVRPGSVPPDRSRPHRAPRSSAHPGWCSAGTRAGTCCWTGACPGFEGPASSGEVRSRAGGRSWPGPTPPASSPPGQARSL